MLGREISVSLVGTQVSKDVIDRLEQELSQYSLDRFTLHVTQNQIVQGDDTEKGSI